MSGTCGSRALPNFGQCSVVSSYFARNASISTARKSAKAKRSLSSSQFHHASSFNYRATCSEKRRRSFSAGMPTTIVKGTTSGVTTAPAPTTAPLPMVTSGRMIAPCPMQTSWPMLTLRAARAARRMPLPRSHPASTGWHDRGSDAGWLDRILCDVQDTLRELVQVFLGMSTTHVCADPTQINYRNGSATIGEICRQTLHDLVDGRFRGALLLHA